MPLVKTLNLEHRFSLLAAALSRPPETKSQFRMVILPSTDTPSVS